MSQHGGDDIDARTQAAALEFAILRFEQEATHARHGSVDDERQLGVDEFVFLHLRSRRGNFVSRRIAMSCAALSEHNARGISLILLDEISGERKAWARKTLDNQLAGINQMVSRLGLAADSRILLEYRDEICDLARCHSNLESALRFTDRLELWAAFANDHRGSAQIPLISVYARSGRRKHYGSPCLVTDAVGS